MKIACWNVNSVRLRLPHLLTWLATTRPDIVCLQELKCTNEAFPYTEIEDTGYNVACFGQKGFNGVALLTRGACDDIIHGLPGFADEQARYIEGVITIDQTVVRVGSLYAPNGNPCENGKGIKFRYKQDWLASFEAHIERLLTLEEIFVMAGDYNIIPTERDVYDPEAWADDALFHPASRAAYYRLLNMGLTDAIVALTVPSSDSFTFWDYQGGAWRKNNGIRIDHHLLSPQAASILRDVGIDREMRNLDKPSDHVPVTITLTP